MRPSRWPWNILPSLPRLWCGPGLGAICTWRRPGCGWAGCPCAFVHAPGGGRPDEAVVDAVGLFLAEHGMPASQVHRGPPRQVYRQFDFAQGKLACDRVAWMDGEPMPGQPLLVPVVLGGQVQPVSLPPRRGPATLPPELVFEARRDEPGVGGGAAGTAEDAQRTGGAARADLDGP
ncbi:MAG: hypothetical protein KatS3mg103_0979 [Phycisphaerales bacterium]|nr:MAG: hypothetical protein KatS3mg103_0979 [Phycisphaerales bacterium]